MNIIKAYKVRCFPTEEQRQLILKTFGCCRWYWNQALSDNIKYYEENKKSKINTPASYKKEYDNREQRVAELLSYADTLVDMEKEFEKYNENATLS